MKLIIKNDSKETVKNPNVKIIETTEDIFDNQIVFIEENDVPIIKYTDTESMYFVKDLDNLYDRKSKSEVLLDITIDNLELIGSGSGGDFVPLTGTTEGNPVTGDIEIESLSGVKIKTFLEGEGGNAIDLTRNDEGVVLEHYYINGVKNAELIINGTNVYFEPMNGAEVNAIGFFAPFDFSNRTTGDLESDKLIYAQRAYVDKANSYSTDEILTGGTWIDGKPIYRKVITWDLSSASMGIPYGVSDLENVVKLECIYKDEFHENFTQLPINRTEISTPALYQSELSLTLNIPDQEIYLRNIMATRLFSTGVTTIQKYTEGGFLYITLKYTKTTD